MQNLLHDLRSIVEHERAVYGTLLPLDAPEEMTPSTDREASAPAPESSPSADPAPDAEAPANSDASPTTDAPAPETTAETDAPAAEDDPQPTESEAQGDNRASAPSTTETTNTDLSPSDDDSPPEPMPNKDLFGNRTRPPEEDPTLPPWKRIDALSRKLSGDAPYQNAETLAEVEEYLAGNVLVPIDEDRENPVFGVGDPEADLVIIGEAPGRDEDKKGEPFVGRAGKLLDKILDAINFEREEVYITNILKSRPPRNRNPRQEEVDAHLPILYKQLALIGPEIILAVGKVAGNTLLDRSSSLGTLRDKEHDFYGLPLMVTYHPAALLRNSQWKRPTWEDVKLLRTRYDELVDEE